MWETSKDMINNMSLLRVDTDVTSESIDEMNDDLGFNN